MVLRLPLSPLDGANGAGLCEGCNKFGCADVYGDSRLSCNAMVPVTRYWHDPMTERLAALTRMCGLRVKVEPAPASPFTNKRVDFTVRGARRSSLLNTVIGNTRRTDSFCRDGKFLQFPRGVDNPERSSDNYFATGFYAEQGN